MCVPEGSGHSLCKDGGSPCDGPGWRRRCLGGGRRRGRWETEVAVAPGGEASWSRAEGGQRPRSSECRTWGFKLSRERRAGAWRHLEESWLAEGHFAGDLTRLSASFIKTDGDVLPARRDFVYLRPLPSPHGT